MEQAIITVYETLRTLKATMLAEMGNMGNLAGIICGLGILFYMAARLFPVIMANEQIDLWDYAKPFALAFVVINFNTLILDPIDYITEGMTEAFRTVEMGGGSSINNNPPKGNSIAFDDTLEREFKTQMSSEYEDVGSSAQEWLVKLLRNIVGYIGGIAYMIIMFIQQVYLLVLSILGPISVAFAIFPAYSSNFADFLGRYVGISLWGPIAIVIKAFLIRVFDYCMAMEFSVESLAIFLFLILAHYAYTFVPSISGMIVRAVGGMGALQAGVDMLGQKGAGWSASEAKHKAKGAKQFVTQSWNRTSGNVGQRLSSLPGAMYKKASFEGGLKYLSNKGRHSKEAGQRVNDLYRSLVNLGYSKPDAQKMTQKIFGMSQHASHGTTLERVVASQKGVSGMDRVKAAYSAFRHNKPGDIKRKVNLRIKKETKSKYK